MHRDAPRPVFRQRFPPPRLLRRQLERGQVPRTLAQERVPQRQRILATGARDLVEEALGGERRVGRPH